MHADTDITILKFILIIKVMKKQKIDIFMRNVHYHQKYPFDAPCRRPRAPAIVFKSVFITILVYVCVDADSIILKRILVTNAMKKLKIISIFSCEISIITRNIDLVRGVAARAHLQLFSKLTPHTFKSVS